MSVPYAVCCKACGNVVRHAYHKNEPDNPKSGQLKQPLEPLTPKGFVPTYCQQCGKNQWQVPASAEAIAKYDAKIAREARATELCASLNMEGLFKIPDDIKGPAELKNALSNLLAPLEGEVLKQAQSNVLKASRSGIAAATDVWVELYDRAVQNAKGAKPRVAA